METNHKTDHNKQDLTMQKSCTIIYNKQPCLKIMHSIFEIEPISRLRQGYPFIINQLIGSFLYDPFNHVRTMPHGIKFPCPQGFPSLIPQKDQVTFIKPNWIDRLTILDLGAC